VSPVINGVPSKINGGAYSVPRCGDLEFGGLENRFQRTCRFKDGEVTTSQTLSERIRQHQ